MSDKLIVKFASTHVRLQAYSQAGTLLTKVHKRGFVLCFSQLRSCNKVHLNYVKCIVLFTQHTRIV